MVEKGILKDMVYIKGGCYKMGDTFGDGAADEKPVHDVCLDDFYLDKYEVHQLQYKNETDAVPAFFKSCGPDCPVESVNWFEAKAYCEKLGKRLPTEAEWEYAAREGGKEVRFGNGKEKLDPDEINFNSRRAYKKSYSQAGKYRRSTVPVNSFEPNELGLYNMSGNVWEWVSDLYKADYYSAEFVVNPQGPELEVKEDQTAEEVEQKVYRTIRGGSWHAGPSHIRASNRFGLKAVYSYMYVGFRCAI